MRFPFILIAFVLVCCLPVLADPVPVPAKVAPSPPDIAAIRRQFVAKDAEIARLQRTLEFKNAVLHKLFLNESVKSVVANDLGGYFALTKQYADVAGVTPEELRSTEADLAFISQHSSGSLTPAASSGDASSGIDSKIELYQGSDLAHMRPIPNPSASSAIGPYKRAHTAPTGDYSIGAGLADDTVLSTGWTSGHGSRTQHVSSYYRTTKSGKTIHVHSYYRR